MTLFANIVQFRLVYPNVWSIRNWV